MNRRTVISVVAAVGALVVAAGLLMATRGGSSGKKVNQAIAGPVLLVPGYGGSTDSLTSLADALIASGRKILLVNLPDNAEGDIDAQARALQSAVTQELQNTGASTVDIVGYSAGGVVTRDYVKNFGGAKLVRRVVTLGSPQHGTKIAGLAARFAAGSCPTACQQLAPDSELLKKLNKGDESPDGPTWVSIYTSQDEVVTPPESAKLDGAVNIKVQDICANATTTHSTLPTDKITIAMVVRELEPGAVPVLKAADCAALGRG
jgi:triacylglycerol esterase/lipase EstA (alpha/beta hydrolase family)